MAKRKKPVWKAFDGDGCPLKKVEFPQEYYLLGRGTLSSKHPSVTLTLVDSRWSTWEVGFYDEEEWLFDIKNIDGLAAAKREALRYLKMFSKLYELTQK